VLIIPCLFLTLSAQTPAPPTSQEIRDLEKRLEGLVAAKDWARVIELLDGAKPGLRENQTPILVQALVRTGKFERVIEICDTLAQRPGPNSPIPAAYLVQWKGQSLSALGRHGEAAEFLLAAGRKGDRMALLLAGNEAVEAAKWDLMLEVAELQLAKSPTTGAYLAMKGQALAKLGRFGEAQATLNEAVHLTPANAMCWADLACCYNDGARYPEALEAASKALELAPRLMEGLCNRGRAFIGLKRYAEGRKDFQVALDLNPADPAVAANLRLNIKMADDYLAYQKKKAPTARKR